MANKREAKLMMLKSKAQVIFIQNNGSYTEMKKNKVLREYKKCKATKEDEAKWLEKIRGNLVMSIFADTNKYELSKKFQKFGSIGFADEKKISFIIDYLNKKTLDTLTAVVIAEELILIKNQSKSNMMKNEIIAFLKSYHDKLSSLEITIDDSHVKAHNNDSEIVSVEAVKTRLDNLIK